MSLPLVEAPGLTVARVAVDTPLAHLDRLFDYAIPPSLEDQVVPGCRVKVRFAGLLRDGWVVGVGESSAFNGELERVSKVVSSEPVLTATTHRLIRAVADHYAGVWWDVARLAIPPRHSTTEKAPQRTWPQPTQPEVTNVLEQYPAGDGFLAAVREGGAPRAHWQAAPVAAPGDAVDGAIEAAAACLESERDVIIVVPTARALEDALPRLRDAFGAQAVAILSSDQGRGPRYRNYLALTRGEARIVVGTRSAVFAPIQRPGLLIMLDEGSDHHVEQRSPYFHARTVAILRASLERCALMLVGHARDSVASHPAAALRSADAHHQRRGPSPRPDRGQAAHPVHCVSVPARPASRRAGAGAGANARTFSGVGL